MKELKITEKLINSFSKLTKTHLIIIIVLVSFAVYFNGLFNGFVWADSEQT